MGGATVEHQARLAVDVDEVEDVAGIDQVRVLDLRVHMPDFRPFPWFCQEFAGDIPKGVALDHRVALRMTFPELHGSLRHAARCQQQQGDECFPHAVNPFIMYTHETPGSRPIRAFQPLFRCCWSC
ncbi:hypothetical protein D9M71_527320 [compost metagenome]